MLIAFPYNSWRGGFLNSIINGFEKLGFDTYVCSKFERKLSSKLANRFKNSSYSSQLVEKELMEFNSNVFNQLEYIKPDIFFNLSGGSFLPDTIRKIKNELKCKTVCLISDNPFDPAPQRDKYFAMSLQYYDLLLNPEPIWEKLIQNVAPSAMIIKYEGGYDPNKFFPINKSELDQLDVEKYTCEVSFTGNSYKDSAEGAYRAGILSQISGFKLKIFGDNGWTFRFKFFPELSGAYHGERLELIELRKLYSLSKVNINLPSPQIITGFQPRIFEIAATKGFQIIDHSEEIYKYYTPSEVVTFKNIEELKEKIKYFSSHEKEREEIVEKMYKTTIDNYSWEKSVKKIINEI